MTDSDAKPDPIVRVCQRTAGAESSTVLDEFQKEKYLLLEFYKRGMDRSGPSEDQTASQASMLAERLRIAISESRRRRASFTRLVRIAALWTAIVSGALAASVLVLGAAPPGPWQLPATQVLALLAVLPGAGVALAGIAATPTPDEPRAGLVHKIWKLIAFVVLLSVPPIALAAVPAFSTFLARIHTNTSATNDDQLTGEQPANVASSSDADTVSLSDGGAVAADLDAMCPDGYRALQLIVKGGDADYVSLGPSTACHDNCRLCVAIGSTVSARPPSAGVQMVSNPRDGCEAQVSSQCEVSQDREPLIVRVRFASESVVGQ